MAAIIVTRLIALAHADVVEKTSKRKKRVGPAHVRPRVGNLEGLDYMSQYRHGVLIKPEAWQQLLDTPETANESTFWGLKWEETFHVPRKVFDYLLEETEASQQFASPAKDRPPSSPLEMKVLSALFVLAHGCAFHICEPLAGVDKVTVQRFYHKWTKWVQADLFAKHVRLPDTPAEIQAAMNLFAKCGFPGAIFSMDGVHIKWDACPSVHAHLHNGKETYPTRVYNVCVDHAKNIVSCSQGFPGA